FHLVALDQMEGGKLAAATVLDQTAATEPKLKQAAWWLASRHTEWGADLSAALRDRLSTKGASPAEAEELVRQLAQLAKSPAIQALLADRLADSAAPPEARRLVLRAMSRAGLKEAPATWLTSLTGTLASKEADVLAEAVTTVRNVRLPKQVPPSLAAGLLKLGTDPQVAATTRVGALAAVPGGLIKVDAGLFDFLRGRLRDDEPVVSRGLAAETLAHARLTPDQLL